MPWHRSELSRKTLFAAPSPSRPPSPRETSHSSSMQPMWCSACEAVQAPSTMQAWPWPASGPTRSITCETSCQEIDFAWTSERKGCASGCLISWIMILRTPSHKSKRHLRNSEMTLRFKSTRPKRLLVCSAMKKLRQWPLV